jgi:hypothetical protein
LESAWAGSISMNTFPLANSQRRVIFPKRKVNCP